jgi:hypothetical protein
MPRATRSKKIVFLEDLTATASQKAIPDIPVAAGAPLAEITSNREENEIVERMTVEDVEMADQLKDLKAAYKTAIGLKKSKKGRSKKGKLQLKQSRNPQEIIDDEQPAIVSPASEEARQILSSDEGSLMFLLSGIKSRDLTKSDGTQSIEEVENTSPSPAVRATRRLVKPQAGQFDNLFSLIRVAGLGLVEQQREYVETCSISYQSSSRIKDCYFSPGKYRANMSELLAELAAPQEAKLLSQPIENITHIKTLEEIEKVCDEMSRTTPKRADTDEDSFIEIITERSPAKPVSRIEDSIEELDKLEDTIEALGQVAIPEPIPPPERKKKDLTKAPITSRDRASPLASKAKTARKVEKKVANGIANTSKTIKPQRSRAGAVSPPKVADPLKTKATALPEIVTIDGSEAQSTITAKKTKRPNSQVSKESAKSVKAVPNFELPGEVFARKIKEKREAQRARSQNQDATVTKAALLLAPKVKSTKPLTKATFELPGEALSRKKKEAHEARLKAQEEEERKRREFKAKPLRKSVAPDFVPRETAASLARKSQGGSPDNAIAATGLPYSSLSLKVAKRGSIVGAHRPSILATNLANTLAPRSPGPSTYLHLRKSSASSGPSTGGHANQRIVSASEVQNQRQRAKEIYNRDTKALEDLERERRERESAAKKSREEAAERGRQASREWAEKQRAKKAMQADKGLSAGFGAGGQLGLKP